MDVAIAELIAMVTVVTVVGLLLVTIPITRRLGRALEEWIRFRTEGAPERSDLAQLSETVASLARHVEALDDRFQLMAERQDFMESLTEARRAGAETRALPDLGD